MTGQTPVLNDCLAAIALLSGRDESIGGSPAAPVPAEQLVAGYESYGRPTSVFTDSVVALTMARTGNYAGAAGAPTRVGDILTRLPDLAPWLSVQLALVRAKTYLLLGDVGAARQLIHRARCVLDGHGGRPMATAREIAEMETLLEQLPTGLAYGYPPLTAAELRVLRVDAHLSDVPRDG